MGCLNHCAMVERHSHAVIETDAILRGAESILDRLDMTLAHRLPDLEEIPSDTFLCMAESSATQTNGNIRFGVLLSAWR